MIARLSTRIRRENGQGGFTLIELLVVIVIIGILLAIAVPSYLNFRNRANESKSQANVRAALPSVETYFADNTGSATDIDTNASTTGYQGMTIALLRTIDAGVSSDIDVQNVSQTSYCIDDDSVGSSHAWRKNGPSAAIEKGTC